MSIAHVFLRPRLLSSLSVLALLASAPVAHADGTPPRESWWPLALWLPLAGAGGVAWLALRWRRRRPDRHLADRRDAILIERERIARELHDTLLQSVQGLILHIQSGIAAMPEDDPARAALERSLDRAEQVLAEGRGHLSALRVPVRQATTLGELLRQAGEALAADHDAAFIATLRGEAARLPDCVFHEVRHIGTEALANAFRHAQARQVRLALLQTPACLVLEIEDDGRGMPPTREFTAGRSGHWGIAGMRERARTLGGRFTLASAPGEGTRIRLEVQLRAPARWLQWLRGRRRDRLAASHEAAG